MTVEEKISHIREAAMEEARARGNEIIDQHQKALEGVFKTHKQEAVMQADTRIKTETASARQQLNTVTSKGQLKLRRQLSRVQNELKNKLFEEVREMAEEYMKTEAYKELLVSYIAKAARFADGNPLTIYINSSDEDYHLTYEVSNDARLDLPKTGGWIDYLPLAGGMILILGGLFVYYRKKRRKM